MNIFNRIADWLETRACTPAYAGWLLGAIAVCFIAAAVNTMVGWLYALGGITFALLGIAAVLPVRSLRNLTVRRHPILPVTAGDKLTVEIEIENSTNQPKTLLQIQDVLPYVLGKPVQTAIENIPPHSTHNWVYEQATQRRGIYRWHAVQVRTAAPVGLFWCRRSREVPATAIVYPTVLPLSHCPIVDEIGREDSAQFSSRDRQSQAATVGLTKALRPYRIGDPTRLIHWRTSARYGELRVRELEMVTGGQEMIIALDSAGKWEQESFEQAVIAAASLYFYAHPQQMQVQLWTALTGLVKGERLILETLAATTAGEDAASLHPPSYPLIWLTQNPLTLSSLPSGSRWLLWHNVSLPYEQVIVNRDYAGIVLDSQQPLQPQLQKTIS